MPSDATEPTSCPDCDHPVYRPIALPVRRPQQTCRAISPSSGSGGTNAWARCGCENAVHRLPTMRPRHRVEVPERTD